MHYRCFIIRSETAAGVREILVKQHTLQQDGQQWTPQQAGVQAIKHHLHF